MELWEGRYIMYGLGAPPALDTVRDLNKLLSTEGNLIFPYVAAIGNPKECELGQLPCQAFRPDVSVIYGFVIDFTDKSAPKVARIRAYPTYMDYLQVGMSAYHALPRMQAWQANTFNQLSNQYGVGMVRNADGTFWVAPTEENIEGLR